MIKVPIVMQMENLECGAASLCMIMAYYGKWIPLEQVRLDCGVSRDGSNAKNILRAARLYGFNAKGYKMELSKLKKTALPVIIHWNFNHFVVLNGFKKNKAVLNDPARGTVEVDMEEFDKSFTGIVLCFEKTEKFKPEGKPRSVWSFAKTRLKGTKLAFAFIIITGIVTTGIGMIIPLFSRIFLDYVLSNKNPEWLKSLLAAMLFTLLFQFLVRGIQGVYWLKIQGKLSIEASASFLWHVLHLPVEFFAQRYTGDIVSRQSANEDISFTLINRLAPILMNIALLAIYMGIMVNYNILLSIIGIVTAVINLFMVRTIAKKRMNMSRVLQRDAGNLAGVTMSGFEMMETIKASGAENGFFQRWAGYFAKQSNGQILFHKSNQFFNIIPTLLQQIASISILMIGVYLILDGKFTIGMLFAFQGFLSAFLAPVNELAGVGQAFIEMRSSMERVEDVMNYKPDVAYLETEQEQEGDFAKLSGEVELRGLTFGYSKLSNPLIEDFSLYIKKGGSVAFVGGSGSGKSTLAKLISGLYQPWEGEILFGNQNVCLIHRNTITGSIAVVDQDIVLFEDTIMDNITMWDKSIEKSTVVKACKDAQIHEDIMNRVDGYEHVINEGGKNFSGGQRQRLEIARALAANPSILILDEATSALDTMTEKLIMEGVKARGITLIIVAHRLSTIRDCDEIIVLDKGKVAERGTHEELIGLNSIYTRLIDN
nr:NHLP family bacteriocin export ABC transporter peptidase/permease/ATPase subunit [Anaerotignum sp.]